MSYFYAEGDKRFKGRACPCEEETRPESPSTATTTSPRVITFILMCSNILLLLLVLIRPYKELRKAAEAAESLHKISIFLGFVTFVPACIFFLGWDTFWIKNFSFSSALFWIGGFISFHIISFSKF